MGHSISWDKICLWIINFVVRFETYTSRHTWRGICLTPSIIYASHPRYSEVTEISPEFLEDFPKNAKYIQFVLECRVDINRLKKNPENKIGCPDTLNDSINECVIDPNFANNKIEWFIKGKKFCKFNKESPVVCTGLMYRITDKHPALLKESTWWFKKHLCDKKKVLLYLR